MIFLANYIFGHDGTNNLSLKLSKIIYVLQTVIVDCQLCAHKVLFSLLKNSLISSQV